VQILADSSAYYFGLGDLLREWNEREAAEHHLARGMDLIRGMFSVDEREYLTLARVHIAEERVSPTGTGLSAVLFLLERLLDEAEANMRMHSVVEILLLLALALEVQGVSPANITQELLLLGTVLFPCCQLHSSERQV